MPNRDIYQEIANQASVLSVIESYGLSVTKQGKSFKAICPFHEDSNPSLSIHPNDKIWKCFVCGEGGNAVSFVYKYEKEILGNGNITYAEAANKVIDICNLPIEKLQQKQENTLRHLGRSYTEEDKERIQVLTRFLEICRYNLKYTDIGKEGRDYLTSRNMDERLWDQLGFGIFSYNADSITPSLKEVLIDTGVLSKTGTYNLFEDRILIPIRDEYGNVVSFSGRTFAGKDPKYLNGQSTELFEKNRHLYNYDQAKKTARNHRLYIVEGFMDVAGGIRMNIPNVVSTLGVDISSDQMNLIKKLKCEVVLVRDNDKAGIASCLRDIPKFMEEGIPVKVASIHALEKDSRIENMNGPIKDLWDLSNTSATKSMLDETLQNGFVYLMDKKYFTERPIRTEEVKEAYQSMKNDGLLRSTFDESMFKDYVCEHSEYKYSDIDSIIHAQKINSVQKGPLGEFKEYLFASYLHKGIIKQISQSSLDKQMFYGDNKEFMEKCIYTTLQRHSESYLSDKGIQFETLLEDTFEHMGSFEQFKEKQSMKHDPSEGFLRIRKEDVVAKTKYSYLVKIPNRNDQCIYISQQHSFFDIQGNLRGNLSGKEDIKVVCMQDIKHPIYLKRDEILSSFDPKSSISNKPQVKETARERE